MISYFRCIFINVCSKNGVSFQTWFIFFYFGIPSTRDMQTLSIPRILFFFYCLISHVHKISITCKFSWRNNLSFSVVLSNWKSKPTRLCLGLYELLSEDIQTPIVHRSLSVPSLFHLFFSIYRAISELYILIPPWLVLKLCALHKILPQEMDVFLKSTSRLASLLFVWFYGCHGWELDKLIEGHAWC